MTVTPASRDLLAIHGGPPVSSMDIRRSHGLITDFRIPKLKKESQQQ